MPFTLTMPKLSPTMEEGTVTKWRKKEGEFVRSDEVLLEVATDKATVEHTALDEGFLRKILVQEGASAIVNQPLAVFSLSKDEDISSYQPEGVVPAASVEEKKQEENPSQRPETKTEVVTTGMKQPAFIPEAPLEKDEFAFPTEPADFIKASPYAKKIAKEQGIDLSTVKGTGPHQRIVSKDLELGQKRGAFVFGVQRRPELVAGSYEEEALSPMRKTLAQRLQQSKSFIPHFYVQQEVDAEPLFSLRDQLKAGDLKVTFNDLVIRAAALALKEHPKINSGFHSVSQSIIRFKTVDISIAVSILEGLITPIIRHADCKNVGQIGVEVKKLAEKAKAGTLARHEYMGGSFTISNLGMYGISSFQGIINPPQAAILCIGGIEEKPVVRDHAVVPGKTMTLSLSSDHRVIDGADAAEFMRTLKKLLEHPALLLI